MKRIFFLVLGFVSLALAIIGIFLPLLPTTPFVLLAAFCFSQSSQALHQRLLLNKRFGPLIYEWEQFGSIRRSAKCIATAMIVGMFSLSFFLVDRKILINALMFLIGSAVLAFIWTRPEQPGTHRKLPNDS
ncbi:MAG: YbaN family protein [Oligoflexales bacterium]|nr:YbaN family protein [Oligoflexales bacterium]